MLPTLHSTNGKPTYNAQIYLSLKHTIILNRVRWLNTDDSDYFPQNEQNGSHRAHLSYKPQNFIFQKQNQTDVNPGELIRLFWISPPFSTTLLYL